MSEHNGIPQTPAEWAREAEFLSIKCDELRLACLGFLDDGVTSPDVSADDVAFVRSVSPQRTLEEVFAGYRKLREDPPAGTTIGTLDEARVRVERLAETRERLKRVMFALSDVEVPYAPPTEEEIYDMMHGPRGRPIEDILREFEQEETGPVHGG